MSSDVVPDSKHCTTHCTVITLLRLVTYATHTDVGWEWLSGRCRKAKRRRDTLNSACDSTCLLYTSDAADDM
eukprot:1875716-Rhodomonas_salina.1